MVPGVTVDLGELELELATLLALKAGSEIELEVGATLRAYLRCGSAQLAVAEVELNPNAMVLKIVEVLA
jgi:flagellar motor switch/type III secretory pathway protein FliN